jgi:glycogen(starch) synthase
MRVFMVGWEFPPFISGGLGTACYGLAKAMDRMGMEVLFVLPKMPGGGSASVLNPSGQVVGFKNVAFRSVSSPLSLSVYSTPAEYKRRLAQFAGQCGSGKGCIQFEIAEGAMQYSGSLYEEVHRYAQAVAGIAAVEDFDVVHAHDWMTYPAGVAAARLSGRPLVVQVHSTEFDRSGEHVNQMIYDIERMGMHAADRIIAVSNFTRNIIINRYGVEPEKVEVVYNGVTQNESYTPGDYERIDERERIVLFLGRVTMQKGPDYFIAAAKKVLEVIDNVRFVVAGSGDMMNRIVEMAAGAGIGHKVTFTGFLRGSDVDRVYGMADLYVMPSVSEPFGIAPLEALNHNVPVLISKQSGVAEVLRSALKVDFWDVNEIANKIVAVLKYGPLRKTLGTEGGYEAKKLKWEDSARRCLEVYNKAMARAAVA